MSIEINPYVTGEFIRGLRKINDSKIVENGLFEVFRNGDIYRITERGIRKCSINITNGYYTTTGMVNGRQRLFYVHRLMATAFIPNPHNKPQVNHIDGNKLNNAVENLEWVTPRENVQHAYETGLINPWENSTNCKVCGEKTLAKDSICSICKREQRTNKERFEILLRIIESVENLDLDILTKRQRKAVELRMEGRTLEEIGKELNITKQGADSLIEGAKNRNRKVMSSPVEYHRIKNKITKAQVCDVLGISERSYDGRLSGYADFKVSEAIKLASLYNCTLDELFSNHYIGGGAS